MSEAELIERELQTYLDKEENLRREDRIKYLRSIFDRHFQTSQLEHVVTYYDFEFILGIARANWPKESMPAYLSQKRIDNSDFSNIMVIEAVITYLNKNNLLKKEVKLDKTSK